MKRSLYALLAVLVPFLVVFLMTTSDILAQTSHNYLPALEVQYAQTGNYPEISRLDCAGLGRFSDVIPQGIYTRTERIFSNGTPLDEIQSIYMMHPADFGPINKLFFKDKVISSQLGQSRVCIPIHYHSMFPQADDPNFDTGFIMKFKDDVPGWSSKLEHGSDVVASVSVSETFAVVFGAIGLNDVWGAQVVGTLERTGQNWGSIVKRIPGSLAAETIGSVLNGFVTADLLYEQAQREFQFGVTYDAMIFQDKIGFVDYSIHPDNVYFRCYLGQGADAVAVADSLRIPDIIRLYLTGEGNQGCIVAAVKLGNMGDTLYSWAVIQQAAVEVLAKEKTRAFTPEDSKLIADRVQEWVEQENDPAPDQFVAPIDHSLECPRLGDNGTEEADIIAMGIFSTMMSLQERMRNVAEEDLPMFNLAIKFTDRAAEVLPDLKMVDRYDTKRPRNGPGVHFAHLTSELVGPDSAGYNWTVEATCFSAGDTYEWIINLVEGRIKSGVTSTMNPSFDHVPPRAYEFEAR